MQLLSANTFGLKLDKVDLRAAVRIAGVFFG